ncbi:MAG: hypothetical protein JSS82_10860 [Bacteroidetes bacterium]|nr:hypothetical protein [Bacteroidota bacterium]
MKKIISIAVVATSIFWLGCNNASQSESTTSADSAINVATSNSAPVPAEESSSSEMAVLDTNAMADVNNEIKTISADVSEPVIAVNEQQLFGAYKQSAVRFKIWFNRFHGGGNCASIALIKAAIGTYGVNGVLKKVETDEKNSLYKITLKNNEQISLSFRDYQMGSNGFYIERAGTDELSKKVMAYSKLCFATMCKVLQGRHNRSYKFYVDRLNYGYDAEDISDLLGLTRVDITDVSDGNLAKLKNAVLYNPYHAIYGSSGNYDEAFTNSKTGIEPVSKLADFHSDPVTGGYTLK